MFEIDTKELLKLEKTLRKFNSVAVPIAERETLNETAFIARGRALQNVRNEFILRNKFVENSIKVERAPRSSKQGNPGARVGSTFEGLKRQEFGATISKRGKHGVAIPTSYSSGEGEGARPRRKRTIPSRRLNRIRLRDTRNPGKTRRQKNKISIQQALQRSSSDRFVFLDLHRKKGIFRVVGGKRNPQVKMVHDLSESSVRVPASPWLLPAVRDASKFMPVVYIQKLRFQIKRAGLFK